jgi:hypothetical protein
MKYLLKENLGDLVEEAVKRAGVTFEHEVPELNEFVAQAVEEFAESGFQLSSLPSSIQSVFKWGAPMTVVVLQLAIDAGITDSGKIADIMFFLNHPERKGRPISKSESNYQQLVNEWKEYRQLAKMQLEIHRLSVGSSVKPNSSASDLLEMLRKVPISSIGQSQAERLRLEHLQNFLVRALAGEQVDDRYWQFTILDVLGREYNCSHTGAIVWLKRGKRPQRALANFKSSCAKADSVKEVGHCLKMVHDAVLCHINALLGWAHHNQGFGDASTRDFAECAWLLELRAASVRMAPRSIYSCFAPLFVNVHKVCT